jgi:hypothetical protein
MRADRRGSTLTFKASFAQARVRKSSSQVDTSIHTLSSPF